MAKLEVEGINFCSILCIHHVQKDILRVFNVPTAARCQKLCQVYPACDVFAYGNSGSEKESCWLKHASALQNNRTISVRTSGPAFCFEN